MINLDLVRFLCIFRRYVTIVFHVSEPFSMLVNIHALLLRKKGKDNERKPRNKCVSIVYLVSSTLFLIHKGNFS